MENEKVEKGVFVSIHEPKLKLACSWTLINSIPKPKPVNKWPSHRPRECTELFLLKRKEKIQSPTQHRVEYWWWIESPQVYFIQLVYNPWGWALALKRRTMQKGKEKQFPPSCLFYFTANIPKNKKIRTRLTVILV